jgi:REP element-mobilizing transposase RayT
MGYKLRPNVPGAYYHVGSRGTNKEPIYFDDFDRRTFLNWLERISTRFGWAIYAYCLMTTHYHLVLSVPTGGLSKGMQLLNCGYSLRTGRRYGRTMHLFRQRFFSEDVESDEHLLEALRYVVLNPCRAAMCDLPGDWPWSSYRSSAGIDVGPPFLATQRVLARFGRDHASATAAYREFVEAGRVMNRQVPVSDTVAKQQRLWR